MAELRVTIRVRPGSSRARVGGTYGDSTGDSGTAAGGALVVRVCEQAVDGKATRAALRALAAEFGVSRREIRLVSGPTSRDKVVAITGEPDRLAAILDRLRDAR